MRFSVFVLKYKSIIENGLNEPRGSQWKLGFEILNSFYVSEIENLTTYSYFIAF